MKRDYAGRGLLLAVVLCAGCAARSPAAGIDGTIEGRLKGTKAEGNVRAKTGTLGHVCCLSGYLKTADGDTRAFSMLANNFLVSNRSAEYVQDAALELLANFTRRVLYRRATGGRVFLSGFGYAVTHLPKNLP